MKSLLCAFFVLSSLLLPELALAEKKLCLKVKENAKVFKNANKEISFIPEGTLLDPKKKNKKETYYLVQYRSDFYWIKKEDVFLGKSSKCQAGEESVASGATDVKPNLNNSDKSPRFQIRVGYSVGGEATATDGFITNVANPEDVRKDQDPLILGNSFGSSLEVSASYIKNLSKGRLRGSLGFRSTKINLDGVRNPDSDNGGVPVPLSSLDEPVALEVTYNALTLGAEYGFKLMNSGNFTVRGYIGAFFEYRLSDSDDLTVLICGTESCPFKATEAQVTSPIKQTAIAPSVAIEGEYKSFVFGVGLDTLYLPTLRFGMTF
jgi:hypothetical protein